VSDVPLHVPGDLWGDFLYVVLQLIAPVEGSGDRFEQFRVANITY
jgi:hypothetical protein